MEPKGRCRGAGKTKRLPYLAVHKRLLRSDKIVDTIIRHTAHICMYRHNHHPTHASQIEVCLQPPTQRNAAAVNGEGPVG